MVRMLTILSRQLLRSFTYLATTAEPIAIKPKSIALKNLRTNLRNWWRL